MQKKIVNIIVPFLLWSSLINAQIFDNFSDGNFSVNPSWTGNTSDWMVNTSFQLQSNSSTANSNFYLSTANTMANSVQWELSVNLAFNTSSTNYADIFLTASASDLLAAATTGYFVRVGGTLDEICLYKKSADGIITQIIDGADGLLNTSNNILKIKVIRDAAGLFNLFRDITGTGSNYTSEGTVTDATFTTAAFFGIAVKQSTASFFQKHFFTDIEIKPFLPDITAPEIVSAKAISNTAVDILFNEPLDNISSQVAANYVASNSIGAASTAAIDATNNALIHLNFTNSFPNGINNLLTVTGVYDLAENILNNGSVVFVFYTPQQFDIVIDELMIDPAPQVGLPNNEWVEIKNTSVFPINIQGWHIADAAGLSGPLPNFILQPDSFVIVCTGTAVNNLLPFGTVLAVTGFPSLDNNGEVLYLQSNMAQIIHSVPYNASWYQNELKQEGGWTLEMIDTKNPCSGFTNWRASNDLKGGTPGKKNSIDGNNPDVAAPKLLRAYATDSVHVILVFDEPMDSLVAATVSHYSMSDGIGFPIAAIAKAPIFSNISLLFSTPLQRNKMYTISAQNVTDCVGNNIGIRNSARVGLTETADSLDVVINEILFNPPSTGTDYVELYNRGNKMIDLHQTYIANRNTSNSISSIAQLSSEPYLFFPKDFVVITENPEWVKSAYITQTPDAFIKIATMPSYNDDAGDVVILNAQGNITDEIKYNDKWHFKLLDNKEGVALERIDYNSPSQSADNWHSAATSVNYGTPSYKNSQYRINDAVQGAIKISPEIVSPDNDGLDDFATLDYTFPVAGYVANITIFDANGRPVRYLQRNALCGTQGFFRWDGLGEKNQQLATGVYVIMTEVFNRSGKKKQFKNPVVLARRN